jgi:hypothetical protein
VSNLSRALAILLACAIAATAQSSSQDWNVVKALAPSTDVRVRTARTVRGTIQSANDDSLILNSGKGQETLARQEISRVSVRERGHRKRNALIGTAVGAVVGAGLGFMCLKACFGSTSELRGIFAATTAGVAGTGAMIGAVIPTGGWREVYKK